MNIGSKAKILKVEGDRATVEVNGRKRNLGIRSDVKVKKGDNVVVFLDTIISKV